MICGLPKCKNKLPEGRKKYCCPTHSIIGASNRSLMMKSPGREALVCSTKDCNRVYIHPNKLKQCSKCRTGANGYCHKVGCGNKIPKCRTPRALFCCDEHAKSQRLEDLRESRKDNKKVPHECASPDCSNTFIKASNAQKYCKPCQTKENAPKAPPGAFVKRGPDDASLAAGKSYHDHRAKICKPGGIDCENYADCSNDYNGQGFKYLHNGGKNCYKPPRDTANHVNYGTSGAMCTNNAYPNHLSSPMTNK